MSPTHRTRVSSAHGTRKCRWMDVYQSTSCLPLCPPHNCHLFLPSMHLLLFCSLLNIKLSTSLYCTGIGRLMCISGNKSQYFAFVLSCLMCHYALPLHIVTISGRFYHLYVWGAYTHSRGYFTEAPLRQKVSEQEFYRIIQRRLKCSIHLLYLLQRHSWWLNFTEDLLW